MAAITLTPASLQSQGGPIRTRVAGEALIQGAFYYIKASDNKAYNAQSDGSAAEAEVRGVAMTAATAAGQYFAGQEGGIIDTGAVLVLGKIYCISTTAGKCIASDELLATEKITVVGVPMTTSRLKLAFAASGAAVPA